MTDTGFTQQDPPVSSLARLGQLWGGRSGAWVLGLCLFAGTSLGLLVVPRAPAGPVPLATPPTLIFLGQPLVTGVDPKRDAAEGMMQAARQKARGFLDRTFTVTVPGETSVALSLSKWGVSIDEERLARLISDSLDPTSPQVKMSSQAKAGEAITKVLPIVLDIDEQRAAAHLHTLKEEIDRGPRSAKFNVRTGQVIPHEDGLALDVLGSVLALKRAVESGLDKTNAQIIITPPARKTDEIAQVRFPKVLGHFETRYSQSERAQDRTYNLRLAAERLDGTVLFPGEEFDFNAVVGPRDEAHGYKVAAVIEDGELVDGIGGGTCQISGTLHGAAFFSGLTIVERYPHTRPSSYIKMGMDATVVYPTINFRFANPFQFPIVIHERVQDGRVYAEVRGGEVDQVVSLIRKIDVALPYEQIERPDADLPRGSRVLAQRGVPGFRLHRYRVVRQGSHTRREKWRDVYPPTSQVIRVGTGGPSDRKVEGVGTPEYTADELLTLTLRRAADGSPGEYAENREAGRFGESGWTQKAGMPFWAGN